MRRAAVLIITVGLISCASGQTTNTFPASGNVGVGTTSPTALLEVNGTAQVDGAINVGNGTGPAMIYLQDVSGANWKVTTSNEVLKFNDSTGFTMLSICDSGAGCTGRVGIGTANPQAALDLETISDPVTGGPGTGLRAVNQITTGSTTDYPQNFLETSYTGSGTQTYEYGLDADVDEEGPGPLTNAYAGYFKVENHSSSATITNAYGIYVTPPGGGGLITNEYGLFIGSQAQTGVATAYGLYQKGSGDINYFAGSVGVATQTPAYPLDVDGQIHSSSGGFVFPDGSTQTTAFNSAAAQQLQFVASELEATSSGSGTGGIGGAIDSINTEKTTAGTAYRWSIYNMTGTYGNSLQFWDYDTVGCGDGGMCAERLTLTDTGSLGIGTMTPAQMLEVNGNAQIDGSLTGPGSGSLQVGTSGILFPGNPTAQTTPWTGTVCGGDYAESVNVSGDRTKFEPGDLLVIDSESPGKFLKSAEPYSTLVTGVYSTKPGVVGRRQTTPPSAEEVPMAMIGIVPTKVSAENGPVRPGDLLVTSSTVGYAMKGTDRDRMMGAIIGKALGSLDEGLGTIEVAVTLQ